MSERGGILAGLATEVLFAVLPLLVVFMVVFHKDHVTHLFASPEWSFGAAILFGQSLTKLMSGLARRGHVASGPAVFSVAMVVVFGLVPSLGVLLMILLASEDKTDPRPWLQVLQPLLFFSGALIYMLFGVVGETWNKPREGHRNGAIHATAG